MLELDKDAKIQMIINRRTIMARSVFELELEAVLLETTNRPDELSRVQTRISDLKNADEAFEQMLKDLLPSQSA